MGVCLPLLLLASIGSAVALVSVELDEILRSQNGSSSGEECRRGPESECYVVRDIVFLENNKVIAHRKLEAKSEAATRLILSKLKTPASITSKNVKINKWPVEMDYVLNPYAQLLIANGYLSEALPLDEMEKKKVLVIGMRGGMVSNFFSSRPNIQLTVVDSDSFIVEVTKKHFGHKDVPEKVFTYIADPLEFLEKHALNEEKYDLIVIDSSFDWDETGTGLICPLPKYLDESVIMNIYDSLEEKGVVTININAVDNVIGNENRVFDEYREIFPSCFLTPLFETRNLLVCSKKENWNWTSQKGRFRKNVKTLLKKFHFDGLRLLAKY